LPGHGTGLARGARRGDPRCPTLTGLSIYQLSKIVRKDKALRKKEQAWSIARDIIWSMQWLIFPATILRGKLRRDHVPRPLDKKYGRANE
jgi:hypothetical protein